jgi:acyl-CoA synthetase (AMP-forming)/AMP-acid ligase II
MVAFLLRMNRNPQAPAWVRQNVKHIFVGTAPLPNSTRVAFEETFGCPLLESYGMTEVLLVASNVLQATRDGRSAGRLMKDVLVHARGPEDQPLSGSAEGELFVRTPFSLAGYLDPESGKEVSPLRDGWLPTGDVGFVDGERNLHITGRLKDLIIHGGTNVSPRAVEESILRFAGVDDVAVVGVAHPFWGEEVVAFVQPAAGRTVGELRDRLMAHCRSELAPDAVPSRFIEQRELPRNSTGKVQKHLLPTQPVAPNDPRR